MVKILTVLEDELPHYISEVKTKHSENAKAIAFSSFIQKVFGVESRDLDFEIPVKTQVMELRGRIDAVFGNLIIEFKKDLLQGLDDAKEELIKYLQSYHEKFPDSTYIGIANDGIRFKVFYPIYKNNQVIEIEEIDNINLEESTPQDVFLWFDSYFFTSDKIIPTSADIKKRFGLESPTFAYILKKLEELFEKVQQFKPAILKYENWNRYLEIVYGDKPTEKKLFFKHTYLSTFVKLLIHVKISRGQPSYRDEVAPILFGDTFSKAGILNFMEEDFFTWIMSAPIRQQASKIFRDLLREIHVYDLEKIDEDILKELYQELVDPDVRKLLGEFYTPDWLAELMIERVLKNPAHSVLDPSCGSGTFLFKTIKFKISELTKKGWNNYRILQHILDNVIGFDVHPLAAIISRTNYLLALKDILTSRKGPISIPVYLSDSLKIPPQRMDVSTAIDSFEYEVQEKKFRFPVSISNDLPAMDDVVEKMRIHGRELENRLEKKTLASSNDIDQYVKNLVSSFDRAISKYNKNEQKILIQNIQTLFDLIRAKSDAIWPYILRNMYKPIAISHRKVDVIIGNPPWIAQQAMKDINYKEYLKKRTNYYNLSDKKSVHNIPNMELASLFFCQTVNQYLKDKGTIAFVMTRSVLDASQHKNFRQFQKPEIKLQLIYDLRQVKPLFRIPSCVLIGVKDGKTSYPVDCIVVNGNLPSTNAQLSTAKQFLKIKKEKFSPVIRVKKNSYYHKQFQKGADLIPRNFWFIDIKTDSFLGFNPKNPHIKSAENKNAHPPWKSVKIEGNVGNEFLFNTVVATDLVPFGILKRRLLFAPILITGNKIEMISSAEQTELIQTDTCNYLKKVEQYWRKYSTGTASTMSPYEWINYKNKLTNQNPDANFRVIYAGSATYMTASIIIPKEKYHFNVSNMKFTTNRFITDVATYYYDTDSEDEAHYLVSIFNSKTLDKLIKPEQSKGDFGPRNIHKLPLTFDIPKYDPSNKHHKILVKVGSQCTRKVEKLAPTIKSKSVGNIRSKLRDLLQNEFLIIDKNVKIILKE